MKNSLNSLFRITISLGLLGLLLYLLREDIPRIAKTLRDVDPLTLGLAVLILLSTVVIMAKRLQLIFRADGVHLSLMQGTNLTLIGYFFNNFLPTAVGGDIVKAMAASRLTGQTVKSITFVLMDRLFGLFTFVLIPSLSFLFLLKQKQNPLLPILIYAFLVLSLFCCVLIFNKNIARRFRFIESLLRLVKLAEKAKLIYNGLNSFRHHKGTITQVLFLSVLGQSIGIVVLYMMALALGAKPSLVYFFLMVPIVQLLSMLPSLGGLGIREGAFIGLLAPHIGREYAVALSILWLFQLVILSAMGGLIYLTQGAYHVQFPFNSSHSKRTGKA